MYMQGVKGRSKVLVVIGKIPAEFYFVPDSNTIRFAVTAKRNLVFIP